MNRVQVFLAGVQKSGTTALFSMLSRHKHLAIPAHKEPHFFDDETQNWSAPDTASYHRLFPADGRLRIDATPILTFWPRAMERVRAYNPNARLILLFRDPLERAWSHWRMEWRRGVEPLPFAKAIREGRGRLPAHDRIDPAWRSFSYVERGRYFHQLQRAIALFGAANILVLRSEDLELDQAGTLDRISSFLGIAPFPTLPEMREHCCPLKSGMLPPSLADQRLLTDELAPDLARFAQLSGLDVEQWLRPISAAPSALAMQQKADFKLAC